MGCALETPNEETRKVRHRRRNESRRFVRLSILLPEMNEDRLTSESAAATAFVKTSKLVNISKVQDFTCE
jgi:hypothetical protein